MIKVTLLPADTYVVVNKTIVSEHNRKLLTMLYQPIIGGISTNLYFTLWSNLDMEQVMSKEFTHHSLMAITGFSIDDIIEAREKLEGIGLIKTYVKKESINQYIYELYSPLGADEFFNNPILSTALNNTLGALEYERLISYFSIPKVNLRGYDEITSSFHDVFKIKASGTLEQTNNIRRNNKLGLSFKPTIDLNNVLSAIPKQMLNVQSITKEMKDFLYKIAFIYDYDDEIFIGLLVESIDDKHNIDKELLRENCRKYYRFENSGKLPNVIYKNQPEYLRKEVTDTSKSSKFIYAMETTSPYEFLTIKNNDVRPSQNDLKILEMLLVDYDLPPGVVNVLVDYVLKINNNKLVKAFVETIATQWKRSNIQTVEEAMNFASKENKMKKTIKTKTVTTKVKEEKPEWFEQTIESNEVSDEEANAFAEKLRSIK